MDSTDPSFGNASQASVGATTQGLYASLLLLALIVAGAIVGLAIQHNWPKVLRIASASAGYFAVLVFVVRSAPSRVANKATIPYWPFGLAGASAAPLPRT